jgi:predicted alpha/beta-hydrolase family hydrolase
VSEIETPQGPARVLLHGEARPKALLMLGHGANGGVDTPDLRTATEVATAEGFAVALVEQPYRVAGKKSSPAAPKLDEAWLAVVEHLRGGGLGGLPLVAGGRSAGARVACRTAAASGAIGVLCLAFPLHLPGRPEKSRLPELDAVEVPTLVVQGESDPFGMPPPGPQREVVRVAGNHSLKSDLDAVAGAMRDWLSASLASG